MENRISFFDKVKEIFNYFINIFTRNKKSNKNKSEDVVFNHSEPMKFNVNDVKVNPKVNPEVIQNKQSVVETNVPQKDNLEIKQEVIKENKFPNFTKEEIQADQLKNAKYKEVIVFQPKMINNDRTLNQNNQNIAVNAYHNDNNFAKAMSFKKQVLAYINRNYSNEQFSVKNIAQAFSDKHTNKSVSSTISKLKKSGEIIQLGRGIYKLAQYNSDKTINNNNQLIPNLQKQVLDYINDNYAGKSFNTKDICIKFSDKGHSYGSISGTITRLKKNKKINQIKRGTYELTK